MERQVEDIGDYGVETIRVVKKSSEPEPVPEPKPAAKKVEEPEELDEEAMYGESVEIVGEKKSLVDESKFVANPGLQDTTVVFLGNEMLLQDHSKTSGWFLGDVKGPQIAENCAIALVNPELHKTNAVHAIATSGLIDSCAQMLSLRHKAHLNTRLNCTIKF